MLTVSVNSADGFVVREGDGFLISFGVTGTVGQVTYSFRNLDETTDASDYVGMTSSPDFSLVSPIEITREIPAEFLTLRDRVDEQTETLNLEVSLDGGVFASGSDTQVFRISILDDIQQHGTSGSDRFIGNRDADIYSGYGGRDIIKGAGGDDKLKGGGGGDRIVGGGGDDRVIGNGGNDKLVGRAGSDFLAGGKGNDKLNGGKGRDVMVGHAGDDVFKFTKGRDVVRDFDKRGDDRVDLRKAAGIDDFDDLLDNHLSFNNGHAIIDDLSGNTLTLRNVAEGSLDANDFLF
jgi:Ca2+-binding RTX toxin-like protein